VKGHRNMANEDTRAPVRRRLRWSLRLSLVVVAVIAIALAWKVNRARAQRQVLAIIRKKGGHVAYDYGTNRSGMKFGEAAGDEGRV
jgi:hypothetical protein